MFENFTRFFKKIGKVEPKELESGNRESKETAKERLHMVLMQDRANVSADFLELMKQEIIDVIKKYIEVNEDTIDVRLITKTNEDGSNGTPSLYANIPILNIRNDMKVENYKLALQSDGSIIAEKIEESPKEDDENVEITDTVDDYESQITNVTNIKEDDEKNIKLDKIEGLENVDKTEKKQEDIEKESRIEQRQNDIIKEIIPAMENFKKHDNADSSNLENNEENNEEKKEEEINKEENIPVESEVVESKNEEESELKKVESQKIEEKKSDEEKKEEVVETVVPLKKSARRGRPKKKDKKAELKDTKVKNDDLKLESSEEYDDDDVTFDDLLKAAEEEDRKKAEQEKKRG